MTDDKYIRDVQEACGIARDEEVADVVDLGRFIAATLEGHKELLSAKVLLAFVDSLRKGAHRKGSAQKAVDFTPDTRPALFRTLDHSKRQIVDAVWALVTVAPMEPEERLAIRATLDNVAGKFLVAVLDKSVAGHVEGPKNLRAGFVENDHKADWRGSTDVGYFRKRIAQELEELKRAIDRGASPEDVARDAADVANYAMMIADVYRGVFEERAARIAALPPEDP